MLPLVFLQLLNEPGFRAWSPELVHWTGAVAGLVGGMRPERGSPNGLMPVVGTVLVQFWVWVSGSQGWRVVPPTTPMYPVTLLPLSSTNLSFQLLPLASRAFVLPVLQLELTMTAPLEVSTVSLLPAKVIAPQSSGSTATRPKSKPPPCWKKRPTALRQTRGAELPITPAKNDGLCWQASTLM